MRKKVFLSIIIIFLLIPFLAFGQRPLEIEYPTTPGGETPTTVETTSLSQYIKYIYNISFGIAAFIAFAALIYAGFLYLSSAGDPNKIKDAKSRILSALLGIGILLISYVLLVAINPETIMLITPELEQIPSSPYIPTIEQLRGEYLGTVKEIGVMGGLAIERIEDTGGDIISSSLVCSCIFAEALCLCTGGEDGDSCEPEMCYAGTDAGRNDYIGLPKGHPCRNYDEIIEWQELLVFYLDELIYYQNRAVGTDLLQAANLEHAADEIIDSVLENVMHGNFDNILGELANAGLAGALSGEAGNLQKDIANIVLPTITYYENYIVALPPDRTDPRTIETLNNMLERQNNEFDLKQDLVGELLQFSFLVEAIKGPIAELPNLTEQCALNTQEECDPECYAIPDLFGGSDEGCHDNFFGCQAFCIGLNPCPLDDIIWVWGQFEMLQGAIENSTQEIIELVDEIRQLEQ
jgi:hypothetical protein